MYKSKMLQVLTFMLVWLGILMIFSNADSLESLDMYINGTYYDEDFVKKLEKIEKYQNWRTAFCLTVGGIKFIVIIYYFFIR